MNTYLESTEWSDRLCAVLREIADEITREEMIFELCRDLLARGVETPPDLAISLDDDCVVVRWRGREVAREFERDGDEWFFEDGPWVEAVERMAVSFADALPLAA